jgi:protein subunit release factor A
MNAQPSQQWSRAEGAILTTMVVLQGRVTDHRVNITEHGMDQVLRGERLSAFIRALQQQHLSELMNAVSTE